MTDPRTSELIEAARRARDNAIAPFSKFRVGAAIRTKQGRIIGGCNIENCTYGLTVCAERVALLSALADGEREFEAVAVVTQSDRPSSPCGPCRQLLWEFCRDIPVYLANLDGDVLEFRLSELFPEPFDFSSEEE